MELAIPVKLFISLLIGVAIGLEREAYERRTDTSPQSGIGSLGVRTYVLITTLGTTVAVLMPTYPSLFLIISATFMVLLVAYYVLGSIFTKDNGLTTDIAILWSYVIGVIIGLHALPMELTIAMTVCLILVLSAKQRIKEFVAGIKRYEIEGFIGFAIIALVILPFLPDRSVTIAQIPLLPSILSAYHLSSPAVLSLELFNPFGVWRVVALITGVEIAGYVLEKSIGSRSGWLLTSAIGGFISSTSTTQSLAGQSKTSKNTYQLVAAAILSNAVSFIQMFVLMASVNSMFLVTNTVFVLTILVTSLLVGLYFYRKKSSRDVAIVSTQESLKRDHIFTLGPAVQFAVIFMIVRLVTKVSLLLFGEGGFIVSSVLSALSGLDAVIINISELAGKTISFDTGLVALALANTVNLISKSVYVNIQGSRDFARSFTTGIAFVIVAGIVAMIVLLV